MEKRAQKMGVFLSVLWRLIVTMCKVLSGTSCLMKNIRQWENYYDYKLSYNKEDEESDDNYT